jgi:uncharacterized membrane protein YbhN (UPF0104 family)
MITDDAPPKAPTRSKSLRLVLVVVVTGGLLWAVARLVDPAQFVAALRRFAWWRVGVVIALAAVQVALRAWRAQLLMPRGPRFRVVMSAVSLGFLLGVATPLRMGVVVRPWILKARAGVRYGTSVAALLAERLLDALANVALLVGVVLLAIPAAAPGALPLRTAAQTIGLLSGVGVVGLAVAAAVGPDGVRRLGAPLGRRSRLLGRGVTLAASLADSLRTTVATPLRFTGAVVVTAVMWAAGTVSADVAIDGFEGVVGGADVASTFFAAVMGANTVVPTPGALGAYEAAGVAALAMFGIAQSIGAAITVVIHVTSFLSQAAMGLVFLAMDGLPPRGG